MYVDPDPHFPLFPRKTCNYFKTQLGKPPYRHRHHIKIPLNLFRICFFPFISEFPETGTKIPRKIIKKTKKNKKVSRNGKIEPLQRPGTRH